MIGIYESRNDHAFGYHPVGNATIYVGDQDGKNTILVLSSYEPTIWNLVGPGVDDLTQVLLYGYHDQDVTGEADSTVVKEYTYEGTNNYQGQTYRYPGDGRVVGHLEFMGLTVSSFAGSYRATQFTISALEPNPVPEPSAVSLFSIAINGDNLVVDYAKEFATCVQLVTAARQVTHRQDFFCRSGAQVETTAPLSEFSGVEDGAEVMLCHGINYNICSSVVAVETVNKNVVIDIKPGRFPNRINPKSKRKIAVVIPTTDATDNANTFDATTVNPFTVRFGATGTEAVMVREILTDVDDDGDTDLILRFKIQDTGLECGDTSAILSGATYDGKSIQGTDSIKTARCQ